MKAKIVALLLIFINFANVKSDIDKLIKSSEVIITRLSFLKAAKTDAKPICLKKSPKTKI